MLASNAIGLVGTIVLGFLLIPRFGLIGAAWSRGVVQVSVVLIETWYVTRRLRIAPPYRALGAIGLASVAQGAVALFVTMELGGAISLVVAVLAAVVVYVGAIRLLGVIPMVDPNLRNRLVTRAPHRMRPLLSRIL